MKTLITALWTLFVVSSFLQAQGNLRPGDTIEIRISGVPPEDVGQWTAPYTIDQAGNLNLPYINQVRAGGLPANEVQALIESKLRGEKIYTQPTISIIQNQSRFVNVGGQVRSPGRIAYTSDLTLMSAINAAGGLNDFADQKKVQLVQGNKVMLFDIRDVRKNPKLDVPIYPGDKIEVPKSWY